MEFAKLHALGNDFLIAEVAENAEPHKSLAALAKMICERHRGIGADGILFYRSTLGDPESDVSALIFNADGSRAEMSGNGVRCLAAFLHRNGLQDSGTFRIRTVSGIKTCVMKSHDGVLYTFESAMGQPITDPHDIPSQLLGPGPVLDHPFEAGSEKVRISLCSMGNPHCSTFWQDVAEAPVEKIGPLLEQHEIFPNRTNVEFIQVVDRHHIRVRFWERGVGRTLASGTGSSAAAVAAMLNGLAASPVNVETELGAMSVRWSPGGVLYLTGPAEFICRGFYEAGRE